MKHKTWGELLHMRSALHEKQDEVKDDKRRVLERKENIVHTVILCAAFFACGLVTLQRGPSMLDLGYIVHTDLQQTTSLFALGAGGHLVGCLVTGMAFARIHTPVSLFWSMLVLCATTAALPWCREYGIMAAVYFLNLACVGCVETGSYADVARRWGSQGSRVLQLLQLSFVIGGVLSPALTQFLLAPTNHHVHSHSFIQSDRNGTTETTVRLNDSAVFSNISFSEERISESSHIVSNNTSQTFHDDHYQREDGSAKLYCAYLITAAVSLLTAIPFLVGSLCKGKHQPSQDFMRPASSKQDVRDTNMIVLFLVATFFFSISAVEESLHQFLFTFLVHEAHWSTTMAALVTSWFWCGVVLVRLAAFFLPHYVADEVKLALSCAALPCVLAGIHVSVAFSSSNGVWAFVFFAGMATSLIFSVSFTWIHANLDQSSGAVSAVVMVSSFLAGVFNPLLLGHFFQRGWGNAGFSYLLLAEACLGLLVFLFLYTLSRKLTATWRSVSVKNTIEREIVSDRVEEIRDIADTEEDL